MTHEKIVGKLCRGYFSFPNSIIGGSNVPIERISRRSVAGDAIESFE
jgi:hypothetical protein